MEMSSSKQEGRLKEIRERESRRVYAQGGVRRLQRQGKSQESVVLIGCINLYE